MLHQFQPFGPANTKPLFTSKALSAVGVPTIVGNGHLKLRLKQEGSPTFDAIGFNMHDLMPIVRDGKPFDIAYELEENTWNGNTSIQIHLRDIKESYACVLFLQAKGCIFAILSVGTVAQLVEQRTENPCVGGSIPPGPTIVKPCLSVTY